MGNSLGASGPFPLKATPQHRDDERIVVVTNALTKLTPMQMHSGMTYLCRSATGAIKLKLPEKGYVNVIDADGSAGTNNITVNLPKGHTIMDGTVNEAFAIDVNFFGCVIARKPAPLKNWSVS